MQASAAKHRDPCIPTLTFTKDSQRFRELRERLSRRADGKREKYREIQRDSERLRETQNIHRNSSKKSNSSASYSCLDRLRVHEREYWGSLRNQAKGPLACRGHFFISLVFELNNRQPLQRPSSRKWISLFSRRLRGLLLFLLIMPLF